MDLRDYQQEAVTAVAKKLSIVNRTLLVAPTASGKSIMIASMVCRILAKFPEKRILILCHQGHLLVQNEEKILILNPAIETGIYCAGQSRKEPQAQVVLASRDSLGRDPKACGRFDFVIVDEAHMIPLRIHQSKGPDKDTHYGKIFNSLNPEFVIGLTGTPWRNKNKVIFGKGRFFEKLAYNIPMTKLIEDGYLCPYVFPNNEVKHIDVDHLEVGSTGDYKIDELEEVTNNETLVNRCLDTWELSAVGRITTIFFCVSRAHAELVMVELMKRIGGDKVAYVDGATTKKERDILFQNIKDGKYKAVINIGVLTTGFDAPVIDCVCLMRPTQSASLFIQMCLDTDTEVLTERGWVNHKTISETDICITMDIETEEITRSPVLEIINRKTFHGELFITIESKRSNLRVTGDHDLLVRTKNRKLFLEPAKKAYTRLNGFQYPVSGINSKKDYKGLSDNEIRFIAWVLSDGSVNQRNITITQSKPKYLEEIKTLLSRLKFRYGEHIVKAGTYSNYKRNLDSHRLSISYGNPRKLTESHLSGCGHLRKYLVKEEYPFIDLLSERQFDIFIDVIIKADGKIIKNPTDGRGNKYKQKSFDICKSHKAINKLQELCVMNGYRADIMEVRKNCSILAVSKTRYKNIGGESYGDSRPVLRPEVAKDESVWCIKTKQGTIITRRKGKVTFMGNCGRGLRVREGKKDCLMLDMAGNFERFNSLEMPFAAAKQTREYEEIEEGSGDTPSKQCKQCEQFVPASARVCGFCGYMFTGDLTPEAYKGLDKIRVKKVILEEGKQTRSGRPASFLKYELIDKNGGTKHVSQLLVLDKDFPSQIHKPIQRKIKDGMYPDWVKLEKKGQYTDVKILGWRKRNTLVCEESEHRWVEIKSSYYNLVKKRCSICNTMA